MVKSSSQHDAHPLQEAFSVFNELSKTLTDSYQDLEAQVARLTEELAAARNEKLKTLTEKERLANRLERLLAAVPGAIIVIDSSGFVVDCNAVARELLLEPLVGQGWAEIAATRMHADRDNAHERRLKDGRYVSLSTRTLGENAGHIVLLTDVSEMRDLQNLVDRKKRLSEMGEMVASLAHQIRTPLSTALLYASNLGNTGLTERKRERFSQKLLGRLRHLERQINDMLGFARDSRFDMGEISIDRLLNRLADAMEASLGDQAIHFEIADDAAIECMIGNEDALHGVLMNLLTNAVEALNGKGLVNLCVRLAENNCIQFVVTDNGAGMSELVREKIFEPFFTTRSNGTGLGLAVVESVIRAHGGIVQCDSVPDQGTEFQVTLPLEYDLDLLPGGYSNGGEATGTI